MLSERYRPQTWDDFVGQPTVDEIRTAVDRLHEFNPMLGLRGCRLGITSPEIYQMQVRAIIRAAAELAREEDLRVVPEIMIPLVGHHRELAVVREMVDSCIPSSSAISCSTIGFIATSPSSRNSRWCSTMLVATRSRVSFRLCRLLMNQRAS